MYKDFRVQNAVDCQPSNETYPARVSGMKGVIVNGTFLFNGKIILSEVMPMNIEIEMALTRCNLDKTGCNFFSRLYFPRLCEKISVKTSLAYKIVKGINPAPSCPFAVGEYELTNNSTLSLDIFKTLPLEGFLWKLRFIFHEKKGSKRIRATGCIEYEVAVVKKTHRKKI